MTVGELIEKLSKLDRSKPVVVWGGEWADYFATSEVEEDEAFWDPERKWYNSIKTPGTVPESVVHIL